MKIFMRVHFLTRTILVVKHDLISVHVFLSRTRLAQKHGSKSHINTRTRTHIHVKAYRIYRQNLQKDIISSQLCEPSWSSAREYQQECTYLHIKAQISTERHIMSTHLLVTICHWDQASGQGWVYVTRDPMFKTRPCPSFKKSKKNGKQNYWLPFWPSRIFPLEVGQLWRKTQINDAPQAHVFSPRNHISYKAWLKILRLYKRASHAHRTQNSICTHFVELGCYEARLKAIKLWCAHHTHTMLHTCLFPPGLGQLWSMTQNHEAPHLHMHTQCFTIGCWFDNYPQSFRNLESSPSSL